MTNEQFIKHLIEEYSKSLHLSSNLEDSDADYDYLDGVLEGRMRTNMVLEVYEKVSNKTVDVKKRQLF